MPEIVPLARNHDRSGFDCGDNELNAFLKATLDGYNTAGLLSGGLEENYYGNDDTVSPSWLPPKRNHDRVAALANGRK